MVKSKLMAGAIAATALVVITAGCSSSGTVAGSSGGTGNPPHMTAPNDSKQQSAGGQAGPDGTWTSADHSVSLVVTGDKAELKQPHDCPGDYAASMKTLLLDCKDGNTDRTTGDVKMSGDGKQMTISWDVGITDTLTKQ